ncbi:MAG: arsenic efflux protein [Clostridia bacterium]|nr:arsenic efflux protein [Clostridia bacterium]
MFLLHAHAEDGARWAEEIFLHGLLDTLKIIPFLFLTYLLMEFIEHKAGERAEDFMKRAGVFAPAVGGALGAIPQCGFSAAAANLYAGRIISMGTIVAVFLSTSDEMLPILISGRIPVGTVALIVVYKALVGILVGVSLDIIIRLIRREPEKINIDAICDEDNCHCERGIWYSAFHHTLTISIFVLLITFAINALVFFVGEENLGAIMYDKPFISHVIAAVFGLIPNCAASVALSTLCTQGLITAGTMMSGLFSGAGVGVLVLFKVNKKLKENALIVGIILAAGVIFGLLGDVIFPAELFNLQ